MHETKKKLEFVLETQGGWFPTSSSSMMVNLLLVVVLLTIWGSPSFAKPEGLFETECDKSLNVALQSFKERGDPNSEKSKTLLATLTLGVISTSGLEVKSLKEVHSLIKERIAELQKPMVPGPKSKIKPGALVEREWAKRETRDAMKLFEKEVESLPEGMETSVDSVIKNAIPKGMDVVGFKERLLKSGYSGTGSLRYDAEEITKTLNSVMRNTGVKTVDEAIGKVGVLAEDTAKKLAVEKAKSYPSQTAVKELTEQLRLLGAVKSGARRAFFSGTFLAKVVPVIGKIALGIVGGVFILYDARLIMDMTGIETTTYAAGESNTIELWTRDDTTLFKKLNSNKITIEQVCRWAKRYPQFANWLNLRFQALSLVGDRDIKPIFAGPRMEAAPANDSPQKAGATR